MPDQESNNVGGVTKRPDERPLPEVGSALYLRYSPCGLMREVSIGTIEIGRDAVREGETIVEVEVKAIRKVKVSLEE